MSIFLIAADLDGTLLRDDHTISDYTCTVWQKLLDKGIQLIPTSGRPFAAMNRVVPIHWCEYVICTNGVHIYKRNGETFSLMWDKSLSWKLAQEVIDAKERDFETMHMHCYIGDDLYACGITKELNEYIKRTKIDVTLLKEWNDIEHSSISKIMCVSEHKELQRLQDVIQKTITEVTPIFSMPHYLEIFTRQASKSHALLYVMQLLNLDASQVLAIGDSYNDVSMLEVCKNSYVMKNAPQSLVPYLPRTQYSNDEDGAANLFEELFL